MHPLTWELPYAAQEALKRKREREVRGRRQKVKRSRKAGEEPSKKMDNARKTLPEKIGEYDVIAVRDYKLDTRTEVATGKVEPTGLPSSNVLYYELSNNAWCCVRPSGTEPKIKFYFGVKGTSLEDSKEKLDALSKAVGEMFS